MVGLLANQLLERNVIFAQVNELTSAILFHCVSFQQRWDLYLSTQNVICKNSVQAEVKSKRKLQNKTDLYYYHHFQGLSSGLITITCKNFRVFCRPMHVEDH